jgi:hypothetical protein
LSTFGAMTIVASHSDKKARRNLADHVNAFIFIGSSENHEKDVYKILKIQTKNPTFSKDVIWLK